jgi:feruloyl esterase
VSHDSQDDDGFQQARFELDGSNNLRKTQEYARLFMVPGMYHCLGGPGPTRGADGSQLFDAINPLVKWVEQGVAPERIIATKFVNDTPPTVQMTRPLCVFPKVAKYMGIGNPNIAANFTCVADEPDFNQMSAPKYGP